MKNTIRYISIGSLPGDRQGMSGAGAGRGSMRTASGCTLNRQISIIQNTAAETHDTLATNIPQEPARSILQDILPATTIAG